MDQAILFVTANWELIKEILILALAVIGVTSSSARGAIAAVSEIMQKSQLDDAAALQKASDLMGKKFGYIPDIVRKWIIQMLFDSVKKSIK